MKRVLIVDNSRLMRSIVKELLTELDLEPIGEAVDAQEGIKAYRALQPDLVTLDLVTPESSGFEMLHEVLSSNPKAKVLVITEPGQEDAEDQALALGACGILHKPVTREDFQRALKDMASRTNGSRGQQRKRRALIVDDSLVMRSMLKELLAGFGVETAGEAADALEAVKAFERYKPDVVTLDLVMPGSSGFDALTKILALDPKAKILVVSAIAQDKVAEKALRLGARAVLQKPLSQATVKSALDKVFPPSRPK